MDWQEKYLNKIVCGDCLELMKELPDKLTDYIITDPIWNVGKDYGEYKDKLSYQDYTNFIVNLKQEWNRICKNKKYAIILGSEILRQWWDIFPNFKVIVVKLGAIVLTRKNNFHLQWKAILTNCYSDRFMTDLWEDIRWPGEGYFFNEERYGHPAMTPLKLMKRLIEIFTKKDDIILDPFMGVGTTAIACVELERNFIGLELNQKFIETANKRLNAIKHIEQVLI